MRRRRPRRTTAAVLGLLAAGLVAWSPDLPNAAGGGRVVFAGSGANGPITRLLLATFERLHPGATIDIPASISSTGGIRAVVAGDVAVALVSRSLRPDEQTVGLSVVPYARTAVVLAAHPAVADDDLSAADLVRIYAGTRTQWHDGREIVVLTRGPDDSSIEVLKREVPGFAAVYDDSQRAGRWKTLFTDDQMSRLIVRTPYGLGLSDLGSVTVLGLAVKLLRVDGVAPSPEAVRDRRYGLVKTLAFAFRPDRVPPAGQRFIAWVRSPDAARLLSANGYVVP